MRKKTLLLAVVMLSLLPLLLLQQEVVADSPKTFSDKTAVMVNQYFLYDGSFADQVEIWNRASTYWGAHVIYFSVRIRYDQHGRWGRWYTYRMYCTNYDAAQLNLSWVGLTMSSAPYSCRDGTYVLYSEHNSTITNSWPSKYRPR